MSQRHIHRPRQDEAPAAGCQPASIAVVVAYAKEVATLQGPRREGTWPALVRMLSRAQATTAPASAHGA